MHIYNENDNLGIYEILEICLNDYEPGDYDEFFDEMGADIIVDVLKDFEKEDYEKLLESLSSRSDSWNKRLVYCLEEKDNPYQIEIIKKLMESSDSNSDLFYGILEEINCNFNIDSFCGDEELIRRLQVLQQGEIPSEEKGVVAQLLEKLHLTNTGEGLQQ